MRVRLLLAALLAPAAAAASPVVFVPDSMPVSLGRHVLIDFNPSHLASRAQTPDSMALLLPAGWRFDRAAASRECTSGQAAAVNCPAASKVGFGHVVVLVRGYLFPGGRTSVVAYLTAFVGHPVAPADPASLILEIEYLGADQTLSALNHYFGTNLRRRYSLTGRVILLGSDRYGIEFAYSGMPGGIQVPPAARTAGIRASITHFKLELGAVRRVRHNFTRVVQTPNGPIYVRDHVLVPHHLLARARDCPASGRWPWEIRLGFPQGALSIRGTVPCGR